MVKGIEAFSEYFKAHQDKYIIIGGVACDLNFEQAGLPFRATKDIDMILLVEAMDKDFVELFWSFVQEAGYEDKQVEREKRQYYRFVKPQNNNYPYQIELFARKPDVIQPVDEQHITPIPVDDPVSSLSAILMDEVYYQFTLTNSQVSDVNGIKVSMATPLALIPLKAKAFIDLRQRKTNGEDVADKEIKKHKNDVVRLMVLIGDEIVEQCPDEIKADLRSYIIMAENDGVDVKALMKPLGIGNVDWSQIKLNIQRLYQI